MLKTLSFASLHFSVAFTIAYLFTGSVWVGGLMALVEPACNTVVFYFHERAWQARTQTTGEPRIHSHVSKRARQSNVDEHEWAYSTAT